MFLDPYLDKLSQLVHSTRSAHQPASILDLSELMPPATMISGGGTHCKVEIVQGPDKKQYIIKDYGAKKRNFMKRLNLLKPLVGI